VPALVVLRRELYHALEALHPVLGPPELDEGQALVEPGGFVLAVELDDLVVADDGLGHAPRGDEAFALEYQASRSSGLSARTLSNDPMAWSWRFIFAWSLPLNHQERSSSFLRSRALL